MAKITVWTGNSLQFGTVDGLAWGLAKPHPPADRRVIQRANGSIKRVVIGGSGAWENILMSIDGAESGLSLGYCAGPEIPSETGWTRGYRLSKAAALDRDPQSAPLYFQRPYTALWRTSPVVDASKVWLGFFLSASGTLPGAKAKFFAGVAWKIGSDGQLYLVAGNGGFLAGGFGGSAGLAAGILTGFGSAQEMKNYSKADFGIDVNIGKKWAEFAGMCSRGADLTRALSPALGALSRARGALHVESLLAEYKKADGLAKAVDAAAKIFRGSEMRAAIAAARKGADTTEFAKTLLACLGVDGTSEGFDFIDVASAGLELSAHAGYTSIKLVQPL